MAQISNSEPVISAQIPDILRKTGYTQTPQALLAALQNTAAFRDACWAALIISPPNNLPTEQQPPSMVTTIGDSATFAPDQFSFLDRAERDTALVVKDIRADNSGLPQPARDSLAGQRITAFAAFSLKTETTPPGWLLVGKKSPDAFSPADVSLLRLLAPHLAMTLHHQRLLARTQTRLEDSEAQNEQLRRSIEKTTVEFHALLDINRDISANLNLDDLLQMIVAKAAALVSADQGTIFMVEANALIPYVATGDYAAQMMLIRLKIGEGVTGMAAKTRQSVARLIDAQEQLGSNAFQIPDTPLEPEALVAVPIQTESNLIGILLVSRVKEVAAFTEAEIMLLEGLARQAAIAVENAGLLAIMQTAKQEIDTLHQVSRRLSGIESVTGAAACVVQQLAGNGLDRVLVVLKDDPDDVENIRVETIAVWDIDGLEDTLLGNRFSVDDLYLMKSSGAKEYLIIPDFDDPQYVDEQARNIFAKQRGVRSAVFVSIRVGQKILGWLLGETTHRRKTFAMNEVRLLLAIAGQLGSAIDRIRKTESLLEAGQRFLTVVDNIPGAIYRGKFEDRYKLVYASDELSSITGYPAGRFSQTGDLSITDIIHPDDRCKAHFSIRGQVDKDAIYRLQYRIIDNDGQIKHISERGRGVFDENDTLLYVDGVMFDVTHRLTLEQAIERKATQFEAIAQVGQSTLAILDVGRLLSETVELVCAKFNFYFAGIFLVDEKKEWAELKAGSGEAGKKMLAQKYRLACDGNSSMVGWVTRHGQSRISPDVRQDNRHLDYPDLPLTRSEIVLPLISRGVVMGAFDVQSEEAGAFTQEDIATFQLMANQLANAIENARLFETTQQWATQLQISAEIGQVITATLDVDTLVSRSVTLIQSRFQFDTVRLYLTDPITAHRQGVLYSIGAEPANGIIKPQKVVLQSEMPATQAIIGGKTILLQAEDQIGESIAAMPLLARQELLGAIEISGRRPRAFDPTRMAVLEMLVTQIATSVSNAQAYQEQQLIAEKLREVDKLKTQFLANMSHELRTPLNSIIGFSRVIMKGLDGPLTQVQETDLDAIHQSGKHLLALINNILDLAKIEAGKMELYFEPVDLNRLLGGIISTAIGLVKDKPIKIVTDIPDSLPPIEADISRLRQVFLNLISNAAKFTHQGSIIIKASSDDGYIYVSVTDTGIGIAGEHLNGIFDEFTQLDPSTTREAGGTGLGLPITRKFVELHHGQILVESEPGRGSSFTVIFPLKQEGGRDIHPNDTFMI